MLNWALYFALRAAAVLVPLMPERLALNVGSLAGTLSYYLFPIARSAILANYEMALPYSTPKEREQLARAAFRNDAKNWLDTLRIGRLTGDQILARVTLQGLEQIDQALEAGKGAILVSMHLGNFDFVGQALGALGYKLTVPVERMKPERLFRFLQRQRESQGIRLVPSEAAPRVMLGALRRGELVGMTIDRHLSGKGVSVRFLGHDTVLARGPAALSLRTGAPLVICIGVRRSNGLFEGFISPAIYPPAGVTPGAGERPLSQQVANVLQEYIREMPDQWLAFSRLWPAPHSLDTAATIENQKRAAL